MQAKAFVGITVSLGIVVLGYSLWHWQSQDLMRFACYAAVAILASGLKVQLPGIDGTMSVNFLFILLGVLELSLPETLVIGCTATSGAKCVAGTQAPRSHQGSVQRRRHDGQRQLPDLSVVSLARWKAWREQAHSADGGGAGFLLREHFADLDRHCDDRRKIQPQGLVRMLFLVVPLLPGGRGRCRPRRHCQPLRRMANIAAGSAADLLGLSLLSPVSGPPRSGKGTSRSREAACRADRLAEHAHDRSAGAGY